MVTFNFLAYVRLFYSILSLFDIASYRYFYQNINSSHVLALAGRSIKSKKVKLNEEIAFEIEIKLVLHCLYSLSHCIIH